SERFTGSFVPVRVREQVDGVRSPGAFMTRFLKKNFLTERRAAALEILGPGEWTPERFVEKMWGGTVAIRFGCYFLEGLVGLGLVESAGANGSVVYRLTEEGRGLLTQ